MSAGIAIPPKRLTPAIDRAGYGADGREGWPEQEVRGQASYLIFWRRTD
ncbi:MAG TPA: hypothetical protein VGJ61_06545 [Solirubrobacterales bacterium]